MTTSASTVVIKRQRQIGERIFSPRMDPDLLFPDRYIAGVKQPKLFVFTLDLKFEVVLAGFSYLDKNIQALPLARLLAQNCLFGTGRRDQDKYFAVIHCQRLNGFDDIAHGFDGVGLKYIPGVSKLSATASQPVGMSGESLILQAATKVGSTNIEL